MKKLSIVCLAVVMAVVFGYGSALADPSSKFTAQCGEIDTAPWGSGYNMVFEQKIKTPSQKDLSIVYSMECGLTTDTMVMSKALARALATAEASVKVLVLVDYDGITPIEILEDPLDPDSMMIINPAISIAMPGEITYARREQTLIAEFAGGTCTADATTGVVTCEDDEMLQLIIDTMTANSFSFIVPDLVADTHCIQVWAKLEYKTELGQDISPDDYPGTGAAAATAYLGKGTVTIETVRMIMNEDIVPVD